MDGWMETRKQMKGIKMKKKCNMEKRRKEVSKMKEINRKRKKAGGC